MTPEEKFKQEVWFVLNKIKKYSLYSPDGQDTEYRVYSPPDISAKEMPFPVEEMKIINKLSEWKAIKIQKPNGRLETAEVEISKAIKKFIAVIYLEILQPKFDEIYKKYEKFNVDIDIPRGEVIFDDNKATLTIGDKECPLPPYKNEHYFCRAMFKYPVGEPVDWSTVYENMTGAEEPKDEKKDKRMVRDARYAINERIDQILEIKELFIWKNKSIKRTQ